MELYEILVPEVNPDTGEEFDLSYHRQWDAMVRERSGGLTILSPAKGEWMSPHDSVVREVMIPVRLMATHDQMEAIAKMSCNYYNQHTIMWYLVTDHIHFTKRDEPAE